MKIAYFNYHYNVQGSTRGAVAQIEAISKQLRSFGHEVNLHYMAARKEKPESEGNATAPSGKGLLGFLKRFQVARKYLNMIHAFLRNIPLYRKELKILKQEKPDVVLAISSYGNYSIRKAANKLKIPFVYFCEDPNEYEYSTFFPQYHPYKSIGRRIEKKNLEKADQITCISEILKGYLTNYRIDPNKMTVIPNGVDHLQIRPGERDKDLEEQYRLQGKTVVGFIGSFNYFDDIDAVADTMANLCSKHDNLRYLMVGHGRASEELQEAMKKRDIRDRAVFTGTVDHNLVPAHLTLMDVVLSPYLGNYLFYGSSMKVLEYMAAGKAAVVTALGQIKEVIQTGYNGMLFDWQDYKTFQDHLDVLVSDKALRESIGRNARKTIEAGWTWEIQARKLEKVLQKAIKK